MALDIKSLEGNNHAEQFNQIKNKYEMLGVNLSQALELFLADNDIKVLSVNHRIKEELSFTEKIERKNYEKPLDEIEDICGIRIICYYQSDVEKICKIIKQEFDVLENQDKEELLKDDQFGYRSTHFIVKIKSGWLQTPNYRGLENLKAEIQIRTVLMHAWAEIEHKLAYKKAAHVPKQFKRKLSRISAKLEEADEQFEELKNEITNYKEVIVKSTRGKQIEIEDVDLNLDSLQAFLDINFPDRNKDIKVTSGFFDELLKLGITLNDLSNNYQKVKRFLPEIEQERLSQAIGIKFSQVGIARAFMDLTDSAFRDSRKLTRGIKSNERLNKWINIIESRNSEK